MPLISLRRRCSSQLCCVTLQNMEQSKRQQKLTVLLFVAVPAKLSISYLVFLFFSSILASSTAHIYLDCRSGLKRGVRVPGTRVSYGNFAVDKFRRLQVSVGLSSVVSNYRECALGCVHNPPYASFNVVSSPRLDEKFPCELLNEDKNSASPRQLVSSQEYHHYSIKVCT